MHVLSLLLFQGKVFSSCSFNNTITHTKADDDYTNANLPKSILFFGNTSFCSNILHFSSPPPTEIYELHNIIFIRCKCTAKMPRQLSICFCMWSRFNPVLQFTEEETVFVINPYLNYSPRYIIPDCTDPVFQKPEILNPLESCG